ncbi:cryptochrome/photolyase family protein [Rhizobium oryziradicis]|uniref:Deoxyribodipyrimidine photolyase n=1 Tax=Rhizobium oryziradicis TaxID=1867956 RepID=A0A1Q8ZKL8_9HYPH|nr:cryptochrome/photolyase family protein [Rhizobium oryziradicis]OLP42443.1 deoxyribodipyrimidine photolyase [Rhizobium oryziradicis]
MTRTLHLVMPDQLSQSLSALRDYDPAEGVVLICETMAEATNVPHHKKKLAFLFASMRHFAEELTSQGFHVRYVQLEDADNSGNVLGEIERAVRALGTSRLVATRPGSYEMINVLKAVRADLGIAVDLREDGRFLSTIREFAAWAEGKKQLRMEFFYREMRKKHQILMEQDGKPTGGVWNFDKENRKPPKKGLTSPKRISHRKSAITQAVLDMVEARFAGHFGKLRPFHFAVTRPQALLELDHFIDHVLPDFGDYQDAMVVGEPYLFHSLLASYLNVGLLLPLEICRAAEEAYHQGRAPLNAVEGFIRQILGWREYIRGIYWHLMPHYGQRNSLQAERPLPAFYWTGKTEMACVAEAVHHTCDHAYSHHIQRLMITGNFALLAGLNVKEVQDWYLAVYSDAFEWVEMPNTLGMALFGDGGIVASKPYAASGKYINRMSNSCSTCRYDPAETIGDCACPFNALYWDFLDRHRNLFQSNQRMPYVYAAWDKFTPERQQAIREQAAKALNAINEGTL